MFSKLLLIPLAISSMLGQPKQSFNGNNISERHIVFVNEQEEVDVDKDDAIILILLVASLGMTSICVFFLLKNKNIIK